jgi:peptidoglycan hydrolase-like protein with peptidoglycan-binding domain
MRAREFITQIFESEPEPVYVAIGDSHAHAVGVMGGVMKGVKWLNLGVPSAASKGPAPRTQQMLANIPKIPKGSVVLVALGANDTANAMVPGKPSRTAQSIASDVSSVVDRINAQQPSKVLFLLFPNGPGRGSKEAKFYGGEFQEEVRAAIRSALGGIPIIDINGKPLTDGVHAGMSTYKVVASQVVSSAKPTAFGSNEPGSSSKEEPKEPKSSLDRFGNKVLNKVGLGDKEQDPNKQSFVVEVPPSLRSPQTADVQKALIALGVPLPKFGVDGLQGKETTAAIRTFQEKNGLPATGDADKATVDKMNAMLKAKPELLATLKKSSQAEVRPAQSKVDVSKPLQLDAVTKGKVGQVLNFVAGPESGGQYDIMFGGKRDPAILNMTMEELASYQLAHARRAGSSAAGRYQIMHFNTINYAKKAGLDPTKDKFTAENQDKMGIVFLREAGLEDWLRGRIDDTRFLDRLSRIWAGLPSPSKGGQSFYGGVGLNKHATQLKMQTALNNLQTISTATA